MSEEHDFHSIVTGHYIAAARSINNFETENGTYKLKVQTNVPRDSDRDSLLPQKTSGTSTANVISTYLLVCEIERPRSLTNI